MKQLYILCLAFLITNILLSQSVAKEAIKDNAIFSDAMENSNGLGGNFFAGRTVGQFRRALIAFDQTMPPYNLITSVSLRLHVNKLASAPPGTQSFSLHKLTKNWGEGASNAGSPDGMDGFGAPAMANDATWTYNMFNTQSWTSPGGDYVATPSATIDMTGLGFYTFSSAQMQADFESWLADPATNFGWILIGNSSIDKTARRFTSKDHPTITNRPLLTVAYSPPLPVVLTSFKGTETKTGVKLIWETAGEQNNAYFLVEHSLEGNVYNPIAKINGGGTTNEIKKYECLHQSTAGNNYYRLAQTDFDGRVKYSKVIWIISTKNHSSLTIFPNPVKSSIQLKGFRITSGSRYIITSASGHVIQAGNLYSNEISVISIPDNIYYLKVYDNKNNVVLVGKFFKQ